MAEEKKGNNFNWKNINYGSIAQGIQTGLQSGVQQGQTANRQRTIQEQIKMNRENFENLMTQRNDQMTQSMAAIVSTEARRGISGASTGIIEGANNRFERENRQAENEMLLTERNLMFSQQMEEAIAKQQKRNSNINMVLSGITAGMGAFMGGGS